MNKENEIFLSILKDAKVRAQLNNQMTLFKFLNLHEQEQLHYAIGKSCFIYSSAGFADGEFKRILVSPFEIDPDFKIILFKICYDKRYITLAHRNILGGLLSLGIERNVIGDIVTDGKDFFVACCSEMKQYLQQEIKQSNLPFYLEEIDTVSIQFQEEYIQKTYFLASLRLDACIANVYNLSRKTAYEMVVNGMIKVNHIECLNPSKQLNVGDIISVRTKGRMKVFEVGTLTRSGRMRVVLGRL